ncbi:nodal modulator 1-like [Dendronephthya gigantea]|uniref:nodal modulator 1-like n=1 Tax=Dendronephthya gigantea TaxID=151771 RepID=UPI0010690434|nr:nodal modulator 1-like [Dendronephthya gigantea]
MDIFTGFLFLFVVDAALADDVVGCGGFVKSDVDINYSFIEMKLYTKQGILKYKTDCAPNNGYFLIPLYDKGDFVLKVEPPQGWSFDPLSVDLHIDGTTDKCTKGEDINFIFTGFTMSGKVVSKGRQIGPSGVKILLKNEGSERETKTTEEGFFSFSRVLPGKYSLAASHPTWTFQTAVTMVEVVSNNIEVMDKLIVAGYDVKGHVLSEHQAIQGVDFILFSLTLEAEDVRGCDPIEPRILVKISKKAEGKPLCKTKSQKDGTFLFSSVPTGEYTLVPFYEGEVITFDVVPTKLKFKVNYKSVVLKTPFEVHGFSVSGKIVNLGNGEGIANAKVSLDGVYKTESNNDGVYVLDNVTSGHYTILAEKPNIFFKPVKVQINPNTPHLTDIKPSSYNLCGQLKIEELPTGSLQMSKRKVILAPTEGKKTDAISATTDSEGKFCFQVQPGKYRVQPVVLTPEMNAGLVLKPEEHNVQIVNEPRFDVTFKQFLASVSGTVHCLDGSCGSLGISLVSQRQTDQKKLTAMVKDGSNGGTFVFPKVLPGKYKAVVLQDLWCWKNKSLDVMIMEKVVTDMQFIQSGYVLKCSLTHNITLHFALEGSSEVVGSFNLTKGVNIFCLNEPGVYTLTPKSCHRFDQDSYKYNTSAQTFLTFTAKKHLLSVKIRASQLAQDSKLKIRRLKGKTEDIVEPVLKEKERRSEGNDTAAKEEDKQYLYEVSYWAKKDEQLEITPVSSELLFYPPVKTVVIKDACPGGSVEFDGQVGVFIDGRIDPPLENVKVFIQSDSSEGSKETMTVSSDAQGLYRVGPLHGNLRYDLSATKEGYTLNPVQGEKGHFKAVKLGKIEIKVSDESGSLLSGVLVSLSGSSFRQNRITTENESLIFSDLVPGEYFFKPMLKEFIFSPVSQIVQLKEGTTVVATSEGKRVAFSCYGSVTSLNGRPQKDVSLEAVGLDSCEGNQEETVTDVDGQYRLRGLQPGSTYRVRVKAGEMNAHIERSTPQYIDIQVLRNDLENVRMIVFRETGLVDVSGNILTDSQFLSSVKLLLYREKNLDSPIHSTTASLTGFFQFPPIASDNQNYMIKLESSLSSHQYKMKFPETAFTASGHRVHVKLEFRPQKHFLDQEASHTSFLFLPILLGALVIGVYYSKISIFVRDTFQYLQNEQIPENGEEMTRSKRRRR